MINRKLDIDNLLCDGHSAFLLGPRGVGKTLLAKKFLKNTGHSLTFDLLRIKNSLRYVLDPSLFGTEIEQHLKKIPELETLVVLVDEVQKLPELLDEVHYFIEEYRSRIQFLITGSSARKLKRSGVNLLAGRAWTLRLHPLSSQEVDLDIQRALTIGTLPKFYLDSDSRAIRSLKEYVETYLREEVLQEALVRRANNFTRFIHVAGQANSQPVNYTRVAKDCGVSTKTAQEYFQILTDTLIAHRIDGWSQSVRKQLRQKPKFYLFDCGVLNAMTGELRSELRPGTYRYGKLFETLVVNEVIRANDYSESGYRLNYWLTNSGAEVDLILTRNVNDVPKAIEIKSSSAPMESDFKGLAAFASEYKNAELICLCQTPREYAVGPVTVYPWQHGIEYIMRN